VVEERGKGVFAAFRLPQTNGLDGIDALKEALNKAKQADDFDHCKVIKSMIDELQARESSSSSSV
jgi:hypothetical protein